VGSRASAASFRDIADYGDGWMPIEYFGKVDDMLPGLREPSRPDATPRRRRCR